MSEVQATIPLNSTEHAGSRNHKSRERRRWGFWSTLGWFAAAHTILFGASIWQYCSGIPWSKTDAYYLQLLMFLNAAGVLWAAARFAGWPLAEYFALSWPRGRDFVRGLGYGIAGKVIILLLTMGVIELLLRAWVPVAASESGSALEGLTVWSVLGLLLWFWITMVILTPFFEELLFRGFLYRGLAESRVGVTGAILITAVVFGLIHWDLNAQVSGNLVMVISNVLLGLLLGWIRWRRGSTTATILVHASYNSLQPALLTALVIWRA
jgi:membrane protease YdiL (CAAX protease family)